MERTTNQKKVILDYLKSVKTHPAAEEVYLEVRHQLPRISLATVYRILNDFSEKGIIRKIPVSIARFDGDISGHPHFICRKCHKIYDLGYLCADCPVLKKKKTKVGKIENYQMYFYGCCNKCSKN